MKTEPLNYRQVVCECPKSHLLGTIRECGVHRRLSGDALRDNREFHGQCRDVVPRLTLKPPRASGALSAFHARHAGYRGGGVRGGYPTPLRYHPGGVGASCEVRAATRDPLGVSVLSSLSSAGPEARHREGVAGRVTIQTLASADPAISSLVAGDVETCRLPFR